MLNCWCDPPELLVISKCSTRFSVPSDECEKFGPIIKKPASKVSVGYRPEVWSFQTVCSLLCTEGQQLFELLCPDRFLCSKALFLPLLSSEPLALRFLPAIAVQLDHTLVGLLPYYSSHHRLTVAGPLSSRYRDITHAQTISIVVISIRYKQSTVTVRNESAHVHCPVFVALLR